MKIDTLNFKDYFRSIVNLNPAKLDKNSLKDYLKIYYHNKKGFNDIKGLFAATLKIIEKHHNKIYYSQYKLIKSYLKAYLENRDSSLSLFYILNELKYVTHSLQNDISYSELETMIETQNILYQLESTCRDVNMTLQEVGYLFLDELEELIEELSPLTQNIIFTALKSNMQKKQVREYYHNYKIKHKTTVFRDIINV